MSKEENPNKHPRWHFLRTGEMPTKVIHEVRVVDLRRARTRKRREDTKGSLETERTWNDKRPHPPGFDELDEINKDPDVETAITVMTEMVASGFFTEMGQDVPKQINDKGVEIPNPHKVVVDKWNELVHADETLTMAVREMFEKGFFAVDRDPTENNKLKVLPSSTMYIWRTKKGAVTKITQEIGSSVVETWENEELKRILWYAHKETPSNPYGKALAFCLGDFVDARKNMTKDGAAVLHRLGYPNRRWESQSKEIMDKVFTQMTTKSPEEELFLDGLGENELRCITEEVTARINIENFQTTNDKIIADGLFAPSMSYLRNATEASATKMLDAIHEHAQCIQLPLKRRIESEWFAVICDGDPVPRLVWGHLKTGVEKVTYGDIASLYNGGSGAITFDQAQDLIKKLGLPLKDLPAGTPAPQAPSVKNLPLLDQPRMQTIQTSLDVIEKNYRAKNIDIAAAFHEATKVIRVHVHAARQDALAKICQATGQTVTQLSPESEHYFKVLAMEIGAAFRERLLPHGAHNHGDDTTGPRRFTVTVPN